MSTTPEIAKHKHRNEVHIHGFLARDPEHRYTQSGKAVCTFTVATKYQNSTEYHRCVAWEDHAERVAANFKKGSWVALAGRLQTRSWEQGGVKRYTTEVIAWSVSDGTTTKNDHGVEVSDADIPF